MPFTDIDPLPPAPQRTDDPDVFVDRADNFVAALPDLVEQINLLMSELEATAALIGAAPAVADAGLTAMTGKTPAADRFIYFTGALTSALATITAAGRTLIAAATAADQRAALGLGTAATQATTAFDAAGTAATAVGALTGAPDPFPQYLLESQTTAFTRTLLDDADANAVLTTLGIAGLGVATGNSLALGAKIIKWGTGALGTNNFPVAFPSTCDVVVFSLSSNIGQSDESDEIVYVSSKSAAGFTLSISGDYDSGPSINWIAIGN